MKYEAVNELPYFEYHDAVIKKIDFKNGRMVWEVSNIHALARNSQNPFDMDMCIGDAVMIFEGTRIESIILNERTGEYQSKRTPNVTVAITKRVSVPRKKYEDVFLKRAFSDVPLRWDGTDVNITEIFGLESFIVLDDGRYEAIFNIMFNHGYKSDDSPYVTLTFSESIIRWDDFSGRAGYLREGFEEATEQYEKCWAKFVAEHKVGDIIDVKTFNEVFPSLYMYISDASYDDDVNKVKITDIQKALRKIFAEWIQ